MDHDNMEMEKHSVRQMMTESLKIFLNFKQADSPAVQSFKIGVFTLIGMLVLFGIGYIGIFSNNPIFFEKFGWLMIELIFTIVILSTSAYYWKAFQVISHSTGMMVGMIQGMLTAFLLGMIFGITNGMFVGAIVGIFSGILLGVWVGKCCGLMGVLEAEMAAFMAGPMGAMTTIMMFSDNYNLFIPIAIAISTVFLGNTALAGHQESKERDCCIVKRSIKQDYLIFLGLNFIAFLILAAIMLYGPKSALFNISLT